MYDKPSVSAPLILDGTHNTRDLGGYRTTDGHITKKRLFLRSDGIHKLSGHDKDYLYRYGVRRVIDLRSPAETEMQTDAIIGYQDIEYYNIPLTDHIHDGQILFPASIHKMYIEILENAKESLYQVFQLILGEQKGCILYHCTAGKDRTGIVSMLLLQLAGVDDQTTVADYAATEEYMPPWKKLKRSAEKRLGTAMPEYLFRSQATSMKALLTHLKKHYGTAYRYLKNIGLTENEILIIKTKFVS